MSQIYYPIEENNDLPYEMATWGMEIPDIKMSIKEKTKDPLWVKAFEWYNKYTHKEENQRRLEMNCAGCYVKVYRKLIEVKKEFPRPR